MVHGVKIAKCFSVPKFSLYIIAQHRMPLIEFGEFRTYSTFTGLDKNFYTLWPVG